MNNQVNWNINKTCCFTGHRNNKLPFNGDRETQGMKRLVSSIHLHIEQAIDSGIQTFISGMAGGIDLICAEIIHNLISRKGLDINLVCAIPYKGQINELDNPIDKYIYNTIIQKANVIYISENRCQGCYKKRNQFMVDNSSMIIGVYHEDDRRSGTYQTISMAKKANLKTDLINLDNNPIYYIS